MGISNSVPEYSYLYAHGCSARNITWQYIHNNGTIPPSYQDCPNAAKYLKRYHCRNGRCPNSGLDAKEYDRFGWHNWDGLGDPEFPCSARYIIWQYLHNNGTLAPQFSECIAFGVDSAKVLRRHRCKEGRCYPSWFDVEYREAYPRENWGGLGDPLASISSIAPLVARGESPTSLHTTIVSLITGCDPSVANCPAEAVSAMVSADTLSVCPDCSPKVASRHELEVLLEGVNQQQPNLEDFSRFKTFEGEKNREISSSYLPKNPGNSNLGLENNNEISRQQQFTKKPPQYYGLENGGQQSEFSKPEIRNISTGSTFYISRPTKYPHQSTPNTHHYLAPNPLFDQKDSFSPPATVGSPQFLTSAPLNEIDQSPARLPTPHRGGGRNAAVVVISFLVLALVALLILLLYKLRDKRPRWTTTMIDPSSRSRRNKSMVGPWDPRAEEQMILDDGFCPQNDDCHD